MKIKSILAISLLFTGLSYSQGIKKSMPEEATEISEILINEERIQLSSSLKKRNLQIIDKTQIKQLPVSTVNELLTYVSGVDIRQRGPFGTQADLNIDGGSFDQNILLLNGQKISDSQTGHHSLNIPISLEVIERIEVVRGPSARLYGVNSLTGVVNIVTKTPQKNELYAHVYGGSSFKKNDSISNNKYFNAKGFQLGGAIAEKKHNHMFFVSRESGTGYRYNTAFDNTRWFYQGNVNPNDRNSIRVFSGGIFNKFGANGFYAAPGDKESEEIVNTYISSISSKHLLSDDFTLAPSVTYRYNKDDYRYLRHNLDKYRSIHDASVLTADIKGNYFTSIADFAFGTELRYEDIESTNIGDHDRTNYGVFAEAKRNLSENFSLNAGVYVNYNSTYGWQFFPGLDASYSFTNSLEAVFSVGSSQRIPSFVDLYLDQAPGNVGNADLKPEEAYQVEGGIKYKANGFSANAFVFYRNINRFIDWVRNTTTVPYSPINVNTNITKGANASLNYKLEYPNTIWDFGLAYSYLDPKFETGSVISKYKIESLKHQLVSTVNFKHKNISVMLANKYNERISYKSYLLTDVRLGYDFNKFGVYLDAQNLFDVNYIEAGAVPMNGRWFNLGVKFNAL